MKITKTLTIKGFIAIFALLFAACDKNELPEGFNTSAENVQSDREIRILEKRENPYSVANMKKAYESLRQEGLMRTKINIEPTHLYVRFLPKDSADNETLLNDSTLTLFPYPLDCKLSEGEFFNDPSLKGSEFRWLYTKVPVGYVSPVSGYEILDELYLFDNEGDESENTASKVKSISPADLKLLEERSLQLTGNADENAGDKNSDIMRAKKWQPRATIRVYDDTQAKYIPLQGVQVRARNWFKWKKAWTNAQGLATIPDKFANVDWSIVWEGDDWDIRVDNYGQAVYTGPNESKSDWYLDIGTTWKTFLYAHMHRACWDYWHNTLGLKIPFKNTFWNQRIKLGAFEKAGTSNMNTGRRYLLGGFINVYRNAVDVNGKTVISKAANLYQTTIHELTHVSHWDMGWGGTDDIVKESWTTGAAYTMSTRIYKKTELRWGDMQDVRFDEILGDLEGKYTPLVIDLIDNVNQRSVYWWDADSYPIDQVSGFNIAQIEKALKGAKTLTQWRNNLFNQNPSVCDYDLLVELFDNYINLQ